MLSLGPPSIIPTTTARKGTEPGTETEAARFVTSNYNYEPGSMTAILEQLELEPLEERRKKCRLTLF